MFLLCVSDLQLRMEQNCDRPTKKLRWQFLGMPISSIAIAESSAGSWIPVWAISTIFLAIISVMGSSRSTRPIFRNVFSRRYQAPDLLRLQRRTLQFADGHRSPQSRTLQELRRHILLRRNTVSLRIEKSRSGAKWTACLTRLSRCITT